MNKNALEIYTPQFQALLEILGGEFLIAKTFPHTSVNGKFHSLNIFWFKHVVLLNEQLCKNNR